MQCDYKINGSQFAAKWNTIKTAKKQDKRRKKKTVKVGNKFCIQAKILKKNTHTHTETKITARVEIHAWESSFKRLLK